jgi:hypothetical protein
MFYPNKMLWIIKSTWNTSEMLVWPTRWEQLNNWEPPQILMPKCVKYNRLATIHLEYVNRPIFLTTYMQRDPYKLESVYMFDSTIDVSTKVSIHEREEVDHFYQTKHPCCSCKVCIGVATIDWSRHHRMSSQQQKDYHFPFDSYSWGGHFPLYFVTTCINHVIVWGLFT